MEFNKNTIIITVLSIIFIFGFLMLAYTLTNTNNSEVFEAAKNIEKDDHVKWSKENKHMLVEYSDLQCPACKAYHTMIKTTIENTDIPKKVTFVYRHFPLAQHKYSRDAAYAAEAAGEQGKFFEMSDKLFETQDDWSKSNTPGEYFTKFAKDLKLDVKKFEKDRVSAEMKNRVQNDFVTGSNVKVNSTPTFFLDGKKITVTSFDAFVTLLKDLK